MRHEAAAPGEGVGEEEGGKRSGGSGEAAGDAATASTRKIRLVIAAAALTGVKWLQ
jgi:hypothetical protein